MKDRVRQPLSLTLPLAEWEAEGTAKEARYRICYCIRRARDC